MRIGRVVWGGCLGLLLLGVVAVAAADDGPPPAAAAREFLARVQPSPTLQALLDRTVDGLEAHDFA